MSPNALHFGINFFPNVDELKAIALAMILQPPSHPALALAARVEKVIIDDAHVITWVIRMNEGFLLDEPSGTLLNAGLFL